MLLIIRSQRELDELDLFAAPVIEMCPDLEKAYLRKVKNPMDFRTIENERLDDYTSITELQDDLILTFRNCCVYNEGTEYYDYAL